ncbi:lysine methyltransferase SET6 [Lecanosticta acicola]|uniref:Lysine methyltransferase SET6 n=1 Tax=Lecanosticta acicola TaxID=111012 RepID=A0AAI8Z7I2_9PEZI|nr:lysine methyltransferase SET6 [Lecanosticta acicola]
MDDARSAMNSVPASSSSSSHLFEIRNIANAGRGVIATTAIPAGTLILRSGPPAFHVIFNIYAKETCAYCFAWDRGRTLPVRENAIGKVFCREECRALWVEEQGQEGMEGWRGLKMGHHHHGRKGNGDGDEVMGGDVDAGGRPGVEEVEIAWREVEKLGEVLKRSRLFVVGEEGEAKKKSENKASKRLLRSILERIASGPQDADLPAYFLSGVLSQTRNPEKWETEVLSLAQDATPYNSPRDLSLACLAYLRLLTLLPPSLLAPCTPTLCRAMPQADNHNAFGIRAAEEAEEYMGYGVYPSASFFNHSCAPNVTKKRVGREWVFEAARDLAEGEECCITYLGGEERELDAVERRRRLREVWGFECACGRCRRESESENVNENVNEIEIEKG